MFQVAALAETGRIENIIPIFKTILTEDVHIEHKQTFNKDIIEFVQAAVAKSDNAEFISEINNILGVFQKQGNIIDMVGAKMIIFTLIIIIIIIKIK